MALAYDYTQEDIVDALKSVGLQKGDSVFVHSNIGFFGRLKDCHTRDELCKAFCDAFRKVLGPEGTLVVPTFTYSFCHHEHYDPQVTPSKCGMLVEYIRCLPDAFRSTDANFSVAAIGCKAEAYTANPPTHSFGENSIWERMLRDNGKIVCMNFDSGSTFIHYIEHLNKVAYRYDKAFPGTMTVNGKTYELSFTHFVYNLDKPNDRPYPIRLDKTCKDKGISHMHDLGKGTLLSFQMREYQCLIESILKTRPRFLVAQE